MCKCKYGGPFTTEQVEDVKTFLRLLPLISIFGVIINVFLASNYLNNHLEKQYNRFATINLDHELDSRKNIAECYAETSLTNSVHLGVTLLIVLNEFIFYPLFQRCMCCTRIKSSRKVTVGIAIQIVRVTTLIVLDIISRYIYLKHKNEHNATIQCIFQEKHSLLSQTLSDRWLAIPEYLNSISLTFLFIGVIEFICSQVPYSMKGIVIGAQYTLASVGLIPAVIAISLILKQDISILGKGIISCEFWYALLTIAANLSTFFILA